MITYLITFYFNTIGCYLRNKQQTMAYLVGLALLIYICGTRYYLGGSDVYVYENVYRTVTTPLNILIYIFTGTNHGVNINYEPGYLLLCSMAKFMGFSYFGFLLMYSCLFYFLIYKGLKSFVPIWGIFIALFMYKLMFYNAFISIRQGMTMALFCYMLPFIRDRKWSKYFIFCTIAFYIHRAALFLYPLYFINYIPTSKKSLIYISLLFFPTYFIRNAINIGGLLGGITSIIGFESKSRGWETATEPINIIHTLECYCIMFLTIIFYKHVTSPTSLQKERKLAIQLLICLIPIFTLFSNWIVMTRVKDYLVISYGMILSYIIASRIDTKTRYLILFLSICACLIGIIRYVIMFDKGHLMHFRSFIFEGVSIFNW